MSGKLLTTKMRIAIFFDIAYYSLLIILPLIATVSAKNKEKEKTKNYIIVTLVLLLLMMINFLFIAVRNEQVKRYYNMLLLILFASAVITIVALVEITKDESNYDYVKNLTMAVSIIQIFLLLLYLFNLISALVNFMK